MNKQNIPSIEEIVSVYVALGMKKGFCKAEFILLKFLPKNNPFGKCCDVHLKKRSALLKTLRRKYE